MKRAMCILGILFVSIGEAILARYQTVVRVPFNPNAGNERELEILS